MSIQTFIGATGKPLRLIEIEDTLIAATREGIFLWNKTDARMINFRRELAQRAVFWKNRAILVNGIEIKQFALDMRTSPVCQD
jgi:hypothetical protein